MLSIAALSPARADYYALYHLNVATLAQRTSFIEKVARAMRTL